MKLLKPFKKGFATIAFFCIRLYNDRNPFSGNRQRLVQTNELTIFHGASGDISLFHKSTHKLRSISFKNKIANLNDKIKPESRRPFLFDAAVAAADEHQIGPANKKPDIDNARDTFEL